MSIFKLFRFAFTPGDSHPSVHTHPYAVKQCGSTSYSLFVSKNKERKKHTKKRHTKGTFGPAGSILWLRNHENPSFYISSTKKFGSCWRRPQYWETINKSLSGSSITREICHQGDLQVFFLEFASKNIGWNKNRHIWKGVPCVRALHVFYRSKPLL